jgi:hypothetical protein
MNYGIALASLYGNTNTKIKTGSEQVNNIFTLAKSRIPYYNISAPISVEQERELAAKALNILHKHVQAS